jgi:phosphatidylglycerol---prolipoprotein diacylglyceryl transferase
MIGRTINFFGVEINTYASLIVVAIIGGAFSWWWRRREVPLPFFFVAAAAIFVPAQIAANLFASLEYPGLRVADVLQGRFGSNFMGGLFGGACTLVLALQVPRIRRLFGSPLHVFDQSACALPLLMAIGRIGCFLSGDGCRGPQTSLPWGMAFPHGVIPSAVPVHPTMLYEAAILLFFYVLANYLLRDWFDGRPTGIPLAIFLAFYGGERFLIEFVRVNAKFWGLSQAQWLSLLLVAGAGMLAFHRTMSMRDSRQLAFSVNRRNW